MTYKVPKNNAYSTLASGITDVALSLSVAAGEGARFPSTYPFHITIDSEILECTNRVVDTLTVTRAAESTSADSHSSGANVRLNITAEAITELQTAAPEGHNAAVLSSAVHNNTSLCRVARVSTQTGIPTSKWARVQLTNTGSPGFDIGTNFQYAKLYDAAVGDGADSSATVIHDTDATFTTINGLTKATGLRYALVEWTDADGVSNPSSGYVTAVTSATKLAIYKTAGADFAQNKKYTIYSSWYVAPVAGIYDIRGGVYYSSTNMVADKSVYCGVAVNGVIVLQPNLHTSWVDYILPVVANQIILAAGDLVTLCAFHNTGADNVVLHGTANANGTLMSISLFRAS